MKLTVCEFNIGNDWSDSALMIYFVSILKYFVFSVLLFIIHDFDE